MHCNADLLISNILPFQTSNKHTKCPHRVLWVNENSSLRKRDGKTNGSGEARDLIESIPENNGTEKSAVTHLSLQDMNNKTGPHTEVPETHDNDKGIDRTVDNFAKGLFPLVFLVFNIFYWSLYLDLLG